MSSFEEFAKSLKRKGKFVKVSNGERVTLTLDCEDVTEIEPVKGKFGMSLEAPVLDEDGNKKKLSVKSDKVLSFLRTLSEGEDFIYGKTEPESGEGNGRLYAKRVKAKDEDDEQEEEEEETPKKKKKVVEEDEEEDEDEEEEDDRPKKKAKKHVEEDEDEEEEEDDEEDDEDEAPKKKKKSKKSSDDEDEDDEDSEEVDGSDIDF